jgi:hypothetical protein
MSQKRNQEERIAINPLRFPFDEKEDDSLLSLLQHNTLYRENNDCMFDSDIYYFPNSHVDILRIHVPNNNKEFR